MIQKKRLPNGNLFFWIYSLLARLRSSSSKMTLRIRMLFGVTSTYSSALMYSKAYSSEKTTGGMIRALSSEPDARMLVSFFDLVTLMTKSFS